jgi:hypothetical protein
MKKYLLWYAKIIIVITLLMLVTANGFVVSAEEGGTVKFTNVSEGDTISQLTTLTGTITFPDFLKYEIFLKAGHDLIWVGNSHSSVVDGNLVRLDPRVFSSGSYQLVVRQVHTDSNYTDTPGPTITIDNPNGVPLPYYPEVEPSFLYPSEIFAIVRVRNCAGEEFHYDYHSPQSFRSSDDRVLPGKLEDTICTFEDLALVPGQYRGTGQGGAQDQSVPIELTVDEWHVYEIIYFGGQQLQFGEVAPDDKPGMDTEMAQTPTPTPKPHPTTTPTQTAAQVSPPTPVPEAPKAETILPTTGNDDRATAFFIGLAVVVILTLSLGGVLAARRRGYS